MDYIEALRPITSRVRSDVTAIKKDGKQLWTAEALTDDRLRKHLNGGPARGVSPIKAGESTTMLGLFDLDSHKGETPWADMVEIGQRLIDALDERGAPAVAFRSSGGKGIHVLLLWDAPQDAYSVRVWMADVLSAIGYRNGTAGVRNGQIEIFPKQDNVPLEGYGNQFILPLAGQSEPLEPLLGLQPMGRDYVLTMDWPVCPPVPVAERPQRATVDSLPPEALDLAGRALMAIPNTETLDRDAWLPILCAYKEAVGDSGVEVAREWSSLHPSHDDAAFDKAWRSIKVGKANGVPADYLFSLAERNGFAEHIITEFDDLTQPDAPALSGPTGSAGAAMRLPAAVAPLKLQRDKAGKIKATIDAVAVAVARPDFCGIEIRHDDFRDELMIAPYGTNDWQTFRDTHYTDLRITLEKRGFHPIGRELIRDVVAKVGEAQRFDSAIDWLESLPPWDGTPRVDTFLDHYFGVAPSPYTTAVSRYLWTALAGRVLSPGIKADMVPILSGPQGAGKSSGVAALVPAPEHYTDISFHEREDDLSRRLRGRLIGELGELRGIHTREQEHIKAWVTRTHESWIPKYREFAVQFPRRLVFIGTTNETEFLADPTGNRRWLPVEVTTVKVDEIARDRLQLWAEARGLFRANGVEFATAERLAVEVHDSHTIRDSWAESVAHWIREQAEIRGLSPTAPEGFTAAELLTEALDFDVRNIKRGDEMRLARVMAELGYEKRREKKNGQRGYRYVAKCPF